MRSDHGGRHELGQNFLHHPPTVRRVVDLVVSAGTTTGPILELGAGDGALTVPLSRLGRPLTAIELDEHRARRLAARLPTVRVRQADALTVPLDAPVVVGNVPFHLTTPILRRLLDDDSWQHAVLLTQWEVARKRAGVGGRTLLTAQSDPWVAASLHGRVPAEAFRPRPGVDGGLLVLRRRGRPLVPVSERRQYREFVRQVFQGRGRGIGQILGGRAGGELRRLGLPSSALPRDLTPEQWAGLWAAVGRRHPATGRSHGGPRRRRGMPH